MYILNIFLPYLDKDIVRISREINFIQKTLSLKKNDRVLEIGCGYGRLLRRLARKQYKLYGVDISKEMIEIAKEKSYKENLNIQWIWDDFRQLNYGNYFDAIFYFGGPLFGPFCNLDVYQTKEAFYKIFSYLKSGGRFLLDTYNGDNIHKYIKHPTWKNIKNIFYLYYYNFNKKTKILNTKVEIIEVHHKYLNNESNYILLNNVKNLIKKLIILNFIRDPVFKKSIIVRTFEYNNYAYKLKTTLELFGGKIPLFYFTLKSDKNLYVENTSLYTPTFAELINLLKQTGFQIENCYSSVNLKPFSKDSLNLYIIMKKP